MAPAPALGGKSASSGSSKLLEHSDLTKRGYKIGEILGKGSYAQVRLAHKDEVAVAVKIVDATRAPDDFVNKFFPRELAILKVLSHPNTIQLFDDFKIGRKTFLVMELAGHGDLLEYIRLRAYLEELKAKFFFRQMCEAVKYLHKQHIIHRDLKCENILLDKYNNIKISDFGFARYLYPGDVSKTFCGSAAYAAPEILRGEPYSGKSYDIWSLGIILYIMICGKMPFDDTSLTKLQKNQQAQELSFVISVTTNEKAPVISSEVKDLVMGILKPDFQIRMTLRQIICSPWLKYFPYKFLRSHSQFKVAISGVWEEEKRKLETLEGKVKTPSTPQRTSSDRKRPVKTANKENPPALSPPFTSKGETESIPTDQHTNVDTFEQEGVGGNKRKKSAPKIFANLSKAVRKLVYSHSEKSKKSKRNTKMETATADPPTAMEPDDGPVIDKSRRRSSGSKRDQKGRSSKRARG